MALTEQEKELIKAFNAGYSRLNGSTKQTTGSSTSRGKSIGKEAARPKKTGTGTTASREAHKTGTAVVSGVFTGGVSPMLQASQNIGMPRRTETKKREELEANLDFVRRSYEKEQDNLQAEIAEQTKQLGMANRFSDITAIQQTIDELEKQKKESGLKLERLHQIEENRANKLREQKAQLSKMMTSANSPELIEEYRKKISELDEQIDTLDPTILSRTSNWIGAVTKGIGGSALNAADMLLGQGYSGKDMIEAEIAAIDRQIDTYKKQLAAATDEEREKLLAKIAGQETLRTHYELQLTDALDAEDEQTKARSEKLHQMADALTEASIRDRSQVTKNLGKVGEFLADGSVMIGEMAVDLAAGAATGTGMLPMALRVFGSSSQQARWEGASRDEQFVYGTLSALTAAATERISNVAKPLASVFGRGVTDKTVAEAVQNAIAKMATTQQGRRALGKAANVLLSAGGEGFEEGLEGIIDPYLQRLTYNPDAEWNWDDIAYQALQGAFGGGVFGLSGNVMDIGTGPKNTGTPLTDAASGIQNEQKNTASGMETENNAEPGVNPLLDVVLGRMGQKSNIQVSKMSLEDFANNESPIWRNVDYDDTASQQAITKETHNQMITDGKVVTIPDSDTAKVAEFYPDLTNLKKAERTPILRERINTLKKNLRSFLSGLKDTPFEFEVNGNILDARLYSTGINEVLSKVTQDKANMLYQSEDIFKKAEYLYSLPDYDGDPNIYRWNYFYTPIQIGNEIMGVRIAVRDLKNPGGSQIYNWGIKTRTPLDGAGRGDNPRISDDVSSGVPLNTNIPRGDSGVKSNDTPNSTINTSNGGMELNPLARAALGLNNTGVENGGKNGYNQENSTVEGSAENGREEAGEIANTGRVSGVVLRGEASPQGDNAGIQGSYVQENGRGSSGIKTAPAEWAKDGITEAGRGTGTERAQEIAKRAGAPVYVVKDAILKAQNPTAHALTSSGVVYLSDAIPPEYGTVIGNHELVHWRKQTKDQEYMRFLDDISERLNHSDSTNNLMEIIANTRFKKEFIDLSADEAQIVFDELNAIVYGFYKADANNAQAQFADAFQDYDGYIAGLVSAIEDGGPRDGIGAMTSDPASFSYLQNQSSEFHPTGENPTRLDEVPVTDLEGRRISKTAQTALEAEATTNEMADVIEQDIASGKYSFDTITDADALSKAEGAIISKGFTSAYADWHADVLNGRVSKELSALGQVLYNNAVNAGDLQAAANILLDFAAMTRTSAQTLQAARILKRLSPENRLYVLGRSAQNIAESVKKRTGKDIEIKVNEELAREYSEARTAEEREGIEQEILQDIANQVPATLGDKVNAWRYTSMLFNPKTHIRNIVGNAAFAPVRMVKNMVGAGLEAAYTKAGGKGGRTKAVLNPAAASDKALIQAAWNDYNAVSEEIMSAGKYDNPTTQVDDMRTIFKFKPLEMARKANSKALEYEDMVFSRSAYAESLAGYLKANGVTAEEYLNAVQEAQPAANNKTASVGETESTAVNTDPAEHTPVEQAVIEEYQNAVDEDLIHFVENSIADKGMNKGRYNLKPVSERAAQDIKAITGIDAAGFKTVMEQRIAEHIVDRHGANGKADTSMQDINDIARMQYVLNNYDRMEYAGKTNSYTTIKENGKAGLADTVRYIKAVNGTYYVVEAVPNTKSKTTYIVSAYMSKNKEGTQYPANTKSPGETSENANTVIPSINTSVPQNGTGVNNKDNTQAAQNPSNGGEINSLIDRARAYAIKEAQKATYRDYNAFSDWVSKWGRPKEGDGALAKAKNVAAEGAVPFKRTPANLLVRGVEYSPLGLSKGIYDAATKVRNGDMAAAEAIDEIASGLTGTVLCGLGALLRHLDFLSGGGSDDEDKDKFLKMLGQQEYALSIGGKTYSIDWLSPDSLPLFLGAKMYDMIAGSETKEKRNLGDIFTETLSILGQITEPMLELSMLSSVSDLMNNVSYADNKMLYLLSNMAVSYASQFVPTAGGQIERTFFEDERQTTYVDRGSSIDSDWQYAIGQVFNKIPGVEYNQIPYTDAWGRTQDTGSLLYRAFMNFISPANVSEDRSTEVDRELERLYDAGYSSVLPEKPKQNTMVDEQFMTANEYSTYSTVKGQTSFDVISALLGNSLYEKMSDEEKATAVSNVYSYANALAKNEVLKERGERAEKTSDMKALESGVDTDTYFALKAGALSGLEKDVDKFEALTKEKVSNTELEKLSDAFGLENLYAGYSQYAQPAGIDAEDYIQIKKFHSDENTHSDYDENGKETVRKKEKVMGRINILNLTPAQKDAMYYACGYAESTIYEAPWR